MSEDIVYRLKNKVGGSILDDLNDDDLNNAEKIEYTLGDSDKNVSLETIEDWIDALESGKKIVNPITPREKIEAIINKYYPEEGKFLITAHDYEILLFYARKAVKEGEADESQD